VAARPAPPGPETVTYGAQADRPDLLDLARERYRADGIAADRIVVVPGALDGVERAAGPPPPG
jgi:hypothetical protein